jgi:sigma-54 dependent transcriptional regulator, flagellar regulatory protein
MREQRVLVLNDGSVICKELGTILDFIGQKVVCVDASALTQYSPQLDTILAIIVNPTTIMQRQREITTLIKQLLPQIPLLFVSEPDQQFNNDHVFDMIRLPFHQAQLLDVLHHCQEYSTVNQQQTSNHVLLQELADILVGDSQATRQLRQVVSQVADNDVNILILGESGTGKEVVARCLHQQSHRHNGPFVPVNCGAIPAELLESELFGHEKGAFTGAFSTRKGRFEMAEGGTIFLDEIGDMPMAMQVKLLRVLQERCFERVGSSKLLKADVHVIAATHRNLEQAIAKGEFREDLYYRLNVFPIVMPALRDRIDDLALLIRSLAAQLGERQQCSVQFTEQAVSVLKSYPWPGNVRELANLIERLMVTSPNGIVDVNDLPTKYLPEHIGVADSALGCEERASLTAPTEVLVPKLPKQGLNLKEHLMKTESALIRQALGVSNGVVARAADYLGMRRTTLVEKMRKYNIKRQAMEMMEEALA